MGAVLSSRLAQGILNVLTVDQVIYRTDSENVYYWVCNQSCEFKPFVANRIVEIQRSTNPEQWRHDESRAIRTPLGWSVAGPMVPGECVYERSKFLLYTERG